jgi:hypothetical protein
MLPNLQNIIVKTTRHWGRKGGKMRTNQLNNKKSHNPVPRNRSNSHKSIFCSGLRNTPSWPDSLVSRETLISHCGKATYNGQIAHILPSPPSTFCHGLAGIPTHNNSTNNSENRVGNHVESGSYISLKSPQSNPRSDSSFLLLPNPDSVIMNSLGWLPTMQSKGLMKNLGLYLVAVWVGVLSASSANVVICVLPTGVARMQLADHECCSACSDSVCAECSLSQDSPDCFAHSVDCCQDVVFPIPPATVVSTVISSVSAASPMVCDLSENSQYNSQIPYIAKDRMLCNSAVNTAILLI